jgi:hypothetical protein
MKLIRLETSDEGTFGLLLYDHNRFLFTGELPWRGNEKGKSCIPTGTYQVQMRTSHRFGRCYEIQDVSERTHILLHNGNWCGDDELGFRTHVDGCVLLGLSRGRLDGQNAVFSSRRARHKFEAEMDGRPFELEIMEQYLI